MEAVDWYNQRVDGCSNQELKSILAHNRDEEKEHAAMLLEWIRRQDGSFDEAVSIVQAADEKFDEGDLVRVLRRPDGTARVIQ